jgi:methionyl-tRNA formyltransferase
MKGKHIALFCATQRGLKFLNYLASMADGCRLTVLCFREEPWEPSFIDDIYRASRRIGAQFIETRRATRSLVDDITDTHPLDVIFAVSWRYMIPREVYSQARTGSFVFHASLLPKNRGFSPTVWSIRRGETFTGATLIEMIDDVDAGDIVDQIKVPIGESDTIADVMDGVTSAYLELLGRNFQAIMSGKIKKIPQNHSEATYNGKLTPADFELDWSQSAASIMNMIRAYTRPYPGAFSQLAGTKIRIWRAQIRETETESGSEKPGQVLKVLDRGGFYVSTVSPGACIHVQQYEMDGEIGDTPSSDELSDLRVNVGAFLGHGDK